MFKNGFNQGINTHPAISVLMSVFNTKEKWLRECVESVLDQSFKDFEFVIVYDCPTGKCEEVNLDYAKAVQVWQMISLGEQVAKASATMRNGRISNKGDEKDFR